MSVAQNHYVIKLPVTPSRTRSIEPRAISQQWIANLDVLLSKGDLSQLPEFFHKESWWRDMLALDSDLRTIQNCKDIREYLRRQQPRAQLSAFRLQHEGKFQPSLEKPVEGTSWVSSMFFFETRVGRGTGVLGLTQNDAGTWKAYSVYTSLQEFKDFEESLGQAGLNMGARLQSLCLSCLIVDRNERIGDNWRKRYINHDPAEFTHMAYLPFPNNWPQFTPKDKLGDWFEAYASIMELNVWLQTSIKSAVYDDANAQWTVTVTQGDGSERNLHPRHLIWCTGYSGEPLVPTFIGQSQFKGQLYHGSQHDDASQHDMRGKKVVVVGTGNSGHGIAQNFYENGAQVTMLQRRGTYVITAEKGVFMIHEGPRRQRVAANRRSRHHIRELALPSSIRAQRPLHKEGIYRRKGILEGLQKAGFELDFGIDGAGISRAYMTRGGGYYVDVGCSPLIADGKIRIKRSPEGISSFNEHNLILKDGTALEADIVVLATGYDNMRTTVRKILGDKVADRCKDVWDLDEEGEVNAVHSRPLKSPMLSRQVTNQSYVRILADMQMWRPSGHPGF
ncbi:hypothetical protein BDV23DRAFT_182117 [Aspergillus alliaceus]|uniref:FAD/NAD(P)-binding domain-containing protein n=1 Tax=Petromyces alliaceus TaxID=209559 RepID=A0A5N7CDV6_PETAA|nr:hypothetical protein BDV23DRAFT_182117 [Aspergillus alliaceus]